MNSEIYYLILCISTCITFEEPLSVNFGWQFYPASFILVMDLIIEYLLEIIFLLTKFWESFAFENWLYNALESFAKEKGFW